MPKSQAAKELAAKQKAQAKAEKQRRKESSNPKDWGTMKQLKESFKLTRQVDPSVTWWALGGFVLGIVVFLVIGLFVPPLWLWIVLGVLVGFSLGMWAFQWRAKKALFLRYKGQAGSSEVALSLLDKKKWTVDMAVAFTRQQDMVHRVVGPAGIVLVGEGRMSQLRPLMNTETRRHEQVAYGTPVTQIYVGEGKNQVQLEDLSKHIKKLPKALSATQVTTSTHASRLWTPCGHESPCPRGRCRPR